MPSQPSINRGTLILLAPNAKDASISTKNIYFVFQYNPEKLTHTFSRDSPQTSGASNADIQRLSEFFILTFDLDSVDVNPPQQPSANGLHPALAMLELMMQPQTVGNQTYSPILVFKWGSKRSVAVRLVGMNVEEKSFDMALNPTRATVNLTLNVLDAAEVGNNAGARNVCLNRQNTRATLVDEYKQQTGQAPSVAVGDQSKLSASAGAASTVESKTKLRA